MRLIAYAVPLFAMLVGLLTQRASAVESVPEPESRTSDMDAMLMALRPVLQSAGKVARVYYAGVCEGQDRVYVVLPSAVETQAPPSNEVGLAAVRAIFRNKDGVSVSEGADGIIRIVIGQVPMAILDTKIPTITFDPIQQYTEKMAIWAITGSDEVSRAEKRLGTRIAGPVVRNSFATEPAEGRPHLPESLTNVTLDQALDTVATTFGGIVMYGACGEPRWYDIYFVSVRTGPGW